jgi:hypothetical protein
MANNSFSKSTFSALLLTVGLSFSVFTLQAQNDKTKTVAPPLVVPDTSTNTLLLPVTMQDAGKTGAESLTLKQCIDYAMQHQPSLNISLINIDVTKTSNSINLAGWLPQVNT